MATVQRLHSKQGTHDIELEFDRSKLVVNEARLLVDDREVDRVNIFYGERGLMTRLDDGELIEVRVHSGMVGELTRAQLRRPDNSWEDLTSA